MKIAIIAEKPSVAREIAQIVKATTKADGYLHGNNYMVTWAFGHLVQLAMPEQYGITGFKKENLPIIPSLFNLVPRQIRDKEGYKNDPGVMKQLKVIKSVFDSCDKIIVATDAGREGELIFRYIYDYLECAKPFERLWISSLTEKAIREGLNKLKQGSDYNNLYYAAKSRSEADWLIGINASQSLCIAAGQGVFSLGRVQTPTLTMICNRYLENKNFVPVPYWQIRITSEKDSCSFDALSQEKYNDKQIATELFQLLQRQDSLRITSLEYKEVNQEPPLLYDLTTLQKEANSRYGFSADKTLQIAQKLYESKLITYPRTGSRYLSEDIFDTIPALVNNLRKHNIFGKYAQSLTILNKKSIDSSKVTDHHAIIITENTVTGLSEDETVIYDMVAGRMLESFSEKCIKDTTTVGISCGEVLFSTKGSVTKQEGWRAVYNTKEDDDSPSLPLLAEGMQLSLSNTELLEKQTKPKPLHTESSLLASMETAGKELEDEEQRQAMKNIGIGTPATRAAIIETLFSRDYIKREKKSLIPAEKGLQVYQIIKDKRIADVEMTGMWENAFIKIEQGIQTSDNFRKGIEVYTSQITEELLNIEFTPVQKETCLCPKCKEKNLSFHPMVARCPEDTCGFVFFRKKNEKLLTDKQIVSLLTTGQKELIKGFISKVGKRFDASLILEEDLKIRYKFPENKKKTKK